MRRDRPIRTGRRDKPVIQIPSVALRVATLVGLAVLLFGIILFRLWFLQILSGQQFVAEANDNRLRDVKLVAPRGAVLDRNGHVIVTNRPGLAVGIRLMDVPKDALNGEIARLAPVLHMRPAAVRTRIKDYLRPSTFATDAQGKVVSFLTWHKVADGQITGLDLIPIRQDVGRKIVFYLNEHTLDFPGVEVQQNYLRAYPQGDLAAQLLGHIGEISAEQLKEPQYKGYLPGDEVGLGGVEQTYDRWLRGHDGVAKIEVDAYGRPKSHVPVPGGRLPLPGDSLVLTIDDAVQKKAEEALQYGINLAHHNGEVRANGGAAVVLDAHTGQVLAMASNPTFNPKEWVGGISVKKYKKLVTKKSNFPLLNRAIMEAKGVGSTFKPIDAIAGLEQGVITPATSFYCPGYFKVAGHTFFCWDPSGHGTVNLVTAITESCDVYFYNVGYSFYLRHGTELEDWARRLGMGSATGIDIPGESAGLVPTPAWKRQHFTAAVDKLWTPGDSVNLAIGQGNLLATPLQLAVAYSAIANGGYKVTPHLGLKIVSPQGQLVRTITAPKPTKLNISTGTLDVLHQALRDAASAPAGTSTPVFGAYPIPVAGKTGTAEVFGQDNYAWYASYAPANDPKYVVVVMIEQGGHGGVSAAPAARMIYDSLFNVNSGQSTGAVRSD